MRRVRSPGDEQRPRGRPRCADRARAGQQGVLVVDDDGLIRCVMDDLLSTLDYEPETVATGEEALARLSRGRYHVVIADLDLPMITGWDVLRLAHVMGAGAGLVAMTGSPTPRARARAETAGWPLLAKPFHLGEVMAAMAAAISGRPIERPDRRRSGDRGP